MIEHTKDGKYKLSNANGKAVLHEKYTDAVMFALAVYERISLAEYCRRCGIVINKELSTNEIGYTFLKAIVKSLYEYHNYQNIFTVTPATEDEKLENRFFCSRLAIEMQSTDDLGKALSKILSEEYNDLIASLKSTFRVSCFTTTPFSQLMWGGSYADEHRGFCLEYTVLPNDEIINICNEKNIPYVNVVKNPNIFEMQEFKTKQ